jgi:hypothetical protein
VAAERTGDRSWILHLGFGVVRQVRDVVGSVVKVVVPQTTVTIVSRKEGSWEKAGETAENVEVSATSRRVVPGCMDGAWDEERRTQSVAAPEGLTLSRPNLEVSLLKCDKASASSAKDSPATPTSWTTALALALPFPPAVPMHNIPAARSFSSTGVRNASESSTKLAGVTGVDWASREDRIEGRRETMENASRDWPAKGPDYDCKMVGYGTVNADLPSGL